MTRLFYLYAISLLAGLLSCRKQLNPQPETNISENQAVNGLENLKASTNGVYALFNSAYLLPNYFRLTALASDDAEVIATANTLVGTNIENYTYGHTPTMTNINDFWRSSYAVIYAANRIIKAVPDSDPDSAKQQLKAENLAVRAMVHIYLVKVFGRPFREAQGASPGVPYLTQPDPNAKPVRNTVKEVYTTAIDDLQKAIPLFKASKPNLAIGKYACHAFLSTLYLDMGDDARTITNADIVINNSSYELSTGSGYLNYFNTDHSADKETIFCLRNLNTDSKSQLGFSGDYAFSNFCAVSVLLQSLLFETPDSADVRKLFYITKTVNGKTFYFVNKFIQAGDISVYSPPLLRLSEVYLNRAEAHARLNNIQSALDDVNKIRIRAGLINPGYLYTVSNLRGRPSLLDVVLDERRLEFAFENGIRRDDLWRNALSMIRNYPGTTIPGGVLAIGQTHPRRAYYLPQNEINLNPNLSQNP